jgi:hypothetical protein
MDTTDYNSTTNTNTSSNNSNSISSSSSSENATSAISLARFSLTTSTVGDSPAVQRPVQRPQSLESARREALGYLLSADAAFLRAEPEYRQCSDNHAHVCLDAAWLLFLTGDLTNLPQVSTVVCTNNCEL